MEVVEKIIIVLVFLGFNIYYMFYLFYGFKRMVYEVCFQQYEWNVELLFYVQYYIVFKGFLVGFYKFYKEVEGEYGSEVVVEIEIGVQCGFVFFI